MSSKKRSSTPRGVVTVCWILSGGGSTVGQFLFHRDEKCDHSPLESSLGRARLENLGQPEIDDLRDRLIRLNELPLRFWSVREDCELCRFLGTLAAHPGNGPSLVSRGGQAIERWLNRRASFRRGLMAGQ